MNSNLTWILFLVLQCIFVISHPVGNPLDASADDTRQEKSRIDDRESKSESTTDFHNEKVISVRITSSVAIGRTKIKQPIVSSNNHDVLLKESPTEITSTETLPPTTQITDIIENNDAKIKMTDVPPELIGANIEFIKQLDAKKKAKQQNLDQLHPCELFDQHHHYSENEEILEQSSSTIHEHGDIDDIEEIPLGRKIPSSSFINHFNEDKGPEEILTVDDFKSSKLDQYNISLNNNSFVDTSLDELLFKDTYNHNEEQRTINQSMLLLSDKKKSDTSEYNVQVQSNPKNESNETDDSLAESSFQSAIEVATENNDKSFDKFDPQISPAALSQQKYYHDFSNKQLNVRQGSPRLTTVSFNIVHDAPQMATTNNQPVTYYQSQSLEEQQKNYQSPKIYSEPAKIYSEPSKFYSEPAKIYSEPAKIYSEPAKVYSEPAKIYSVPSKFYSEPASLHLGPSGAPTHAPWQQARFIDRTTISTTPTTTIEDRFITTKSSVTQDHQPEKNYEIDENVSVLTNGRSHGVQETTTEKCKQDNCKVGYVVEGRQFKKYRVEERTSDGFIVGEYGVVRNEDGALRGVRYTADSDASPRLIQDALMKFLQLR